MPSKYDRLINQLWPGEEGKQARAIAHAWVGRFESEPTMADRIEPLLREALRGDQLIQSGEKTPEEARAYLASFATEALGTPVHMVMAIEDWRPDPGLFPPETPAEAEKPAAEPAREQQPAASQPRATAQAQLAPAAATPDRTALQQEIERHQANMRAPEGSAEWRQYWREGGSAQYLAALQAMETAAGAQPASVTIAIDSMQEPTSTSRVTTTD
jgi:hypothetical protein